MLLWLALAGCQPEQAFFPVADDATDGGAWLAEETADHTARREHFRIGADAPALVTDFLFVVDGSASMKTVLDSLHAGFRGLADADPFPVKTRVAVTGTTPADPYDLTLAHPAVRTPRVSAAPDFLRLVSRDTLAGRRRAPIAGCDAWFRPSATNADGVPCLVAHTQLSLAPVGAEAGLTAFAQLVEARGPLFRPGAAANVVFVSDTHDPGFAEIDRPERQDLVDFQPTYADLRELVLATHDVASFRVHAIAPASPCGERWARASYFVAAEAGDGLTLDICSTSDYSAFIRDIARTGAVVDRPMVPLGRTAERVDAVRLDGRAVPYDVVGDGRALSLRAALPEHAADLEVVYRVTSD